MDTVKILDKKEEQKEENGEYREEKYRWVVLGVYLIGALVNNMPTQTFSSINTLVQNKFHYSATIVTLNILIFPILSTTTAIPINWFLDKFGLAISCSSGGILVIAGVWFRTMIQIDYPGYCLFGSFLIGVGSIFMTHSPTMLALNWFKTESIPGIISISIIVTLVSAGIGGSLPGFLLSKESSVDQIRNFLITQAIIMTIPTIIMIIFLRNKPKTPPSKAAHKTEAVNKQKYFSVLKKLFTNVEYLKIMAAISFSYGIITSYLAIIDQCIASIDPKADSGRITAYIMISCVFTGIFATPFFINRLRATLQYRQICLITSGSCFLLYLFLQLAIIFHYTQTFVILTLSACTGFFAIPITPLLISYGSECAFPTGQGSSTGYLFAMSQLFGFVTGLICINLIDKNNPRNTILILLGHSLFYLLGFISIYFTKETLNRTKFQHRKKLSQQNFPQTIN